MKFNTFTPLLFALWLLVVCIASDGCEATSSPNQFQTETHLMDYSRLAANSTLGQESPELAGSGPEAGQQLTGLRGRIKTWLNQHPVFRYPHPPVVHFPLGLLAAAALFELLALITSSSRTEWAAYCCLLVGTLSLPLALLTGYFGWWIDYGALESPIIFMKRLFAWVALVLSVFAVLLRSFVLDEPLQVRNLYVLIYFAAVGTVAGIVSYVGFLGGKLTFPY